MCVCVLLVSGLCAWTSQLLLSLCTCACLPVLFSPVCIATTTTPASSSSLLLALVRWRMNDHKLSLERRSFIHAQAQTQTQTDTQADTRKEKNRNSAQADHKQQQQQQTCVRACVCVCAHHCTKSSGLLKPPFLFMYWRNLRGFARRVITNPSALPSTCCPFVVPNPPNPMSDAMSPACSSHVTKRERESVCVCVCVCVCVRVERAGRRKHTGAAQGAHVTCRCGALLKRCFAGKTTAKRSPHLHLFCFHW